MAQRIKMWWARNFKVISIKQAKKWELFFVRNIFGDPINHYNCRSIWKDSKGRLYRVKQLYLIELDDEYSGIVNKFFWDLI